MSNKIYDLRREIKPIQIKRAISAKLVEINFNFEKATDHKKLYDSIITKIAKKIIRPIIESSKSKEDKIKSLIELVSNTDNIEVSIEDVTVYVDAEHSYMKKLVKDVCRCKNGKSCKSLSLKEIDESTPLHIIVKDKAANKLDFLSLLSIKLNKTASKRWSVSGKNNYYNFGDLSKELAKIYLANELHKYAYREDNLDMKGYLLMKLVCENNQFSNRGLFDVTNRLLEHYNLPKLENYTPGDKRKEISGCFGDESIFAINAIYSPIEDSSGVYFSLAWMPWFSERKIILFLQSMIEENIEIKAEAKRMNDIANSYARAFETKKNIPDKVLKKMKNNKFLNWFGYVEFDELCDLKKIVHIENEFELFAKFIHLPPMKDHSLRFRRLGKHRAEGLYFPEPKAVCVDIKYPRSMVHEMFHMIDYTTLDRGCLSSVYNFRSIIERYRTVADNLVEKLPDEDPFKSLWKGKSKYNKDYYLNSKEIFARCGEIYMKRILGFDNSLVDATGAIVYPKDKILDNMIEKYFYSIFGDVGKDTEDNNEVAAAKVPDFLDTKDNVPYQINVIESEDGQLNFI
jgi:hypothetical protein